MYGFLSNLWRLDLQTKVVSPLTKLQNDEETYSGLCSYFSLKTFCSYYSVLLGIIHPYSHILYTKPKPETNEIEESLNLNQSSDHDGVLFLNFLQFRTSFSIDLFLNL